MRPTSALSRLGLRLGVLVGMFFVGSVGIMNLCLHCRPSGLRAGRWAVEEEEFHDVNKCQPTVISPHQQPK
jgi:hypothetical protein